MDLMPVKQAIASGKLPMSLQTAYKMHCLKKNPALIFKVGGRLMVDLDEYANMATRARDAHVKRSEAVRAVAHD